MRILKGFWFACGVFGVLLFTAAMMIGVIEGLHYAFGGN
jgi:hypothetical protein